MTSETITVDWPTESNIIVGKRPNVTFILIQRLLHGSGIITSIFYIIIKYFVQPSLEKQIQQRYEFSAFTLLKARSLVQKLQRYSKNVDGDGNVRDESDIHLHFSNSDVEDGFDYYGLTKTNGHSRENVSMYGAITRINKHLTDCNKRLIRFNNSEWRSRDTDNDEDSAIMNSQIELFNFQARLLVDQLELSDNSSELAKISNEITTNIRELKGKFINGFI
ncbi:hypothetical protein TBLA_0B00270 [Henningerozyma blattae CBS 6284]|uniref:Uncharacterized protein n=1 Tax=Henningerozyma blattae (strain ATCC 34711 / CBS 6284 / DSM 70876 / NBRC 10599 / NRRL Y-10934 / UCD 77-7) TaxID=1071380 RepID=I2GXM0_HENB6|nr:hypothetical protein TBLA_0B00270 [Tetrapisispora blattae CBS 6284]CCH58872.1 hypothetical protein TBLA_0B00270 [Tetrapisispora blattae CBS 6284]